MQSRFDRYYYFGKKKFFSAIKSLAINKIIGRCKGPKIFINSVPKAGTHLLESLIENLPLMRNTAQRTIRGWDKLTEAGINDIKNISKGSFRKGHVPAHPDLINILKENEVKCIFVIRDPRDITVSNFRYITYIDSTHPAHHYFCNLRTDNERLKVSICGQKGIIDGIDKTLDLFSGFLYQKNVLTVKFEELIGPNGGGSESLQKECLHRISDFVNVSIKKEEFARIVNSIFNPKTLTFNKGKVGNWKDFYRPEHEELINERCENLIKEYGYEIRR